MTDEKKEQLIREVINSFAGDTLGEVMDFALLIIINAWKINDAKVESIDIICEEAPKLLRASMEHELEQLIIEKASKK